MDKLQRYKKEVDGFLSSFLASKKNDFSKVNSWGPDALGKIQGIVSEGKTIRGGLVLLLHDLLGGKAKNDALKVAAAYELIQTALVIHDDIMDRDTTRRGKPTIHVQYGSDAIAMCVGDILFFLAHELLSGISVQAVSDRIFQEVGIAQMQDVSFSLKKDTPSKKEILDLYKYKTARYTFALPMMAGAMLAKADKRVTNNLEKLGEAMGILFQIQNDTLNVQGDTRENKKTLARHYNTHDESKRYLKEAVQLLKTLKTHIDTTPLLALLDKVHI